MNQSRLNNATKRIKEIDKLLGLELQKIKVIEIELKELEYEKV